VFDAIKKREKKKVGTKLTRVPRVGKMFVPTLQKRKEVKIRHNGKPPKRAEPVSRKWGDKDQLKKEG